MDSTTLITKRLHISGLTPALTPDDLSRRLSTFGEVKSVDGFGLQDGVGQPRKFGYITLETTTGQLARCLNLLSGSTWKGAKLRIGEAKPDFGERLALERRAASDAPPKKKRKRSGGKYAPDMTLVTPENIAGRGGWKVTPLGRMLRPVRMRPERPLPPVQEDVGKEWRVGNKRGVDTQEERTKKKKRVKDGDVRARRRTIDMTRWGSVQLKGMFLGLEIAGVQRSDMVRKGEAAELGPDSESESDGDEEGEEMKRPDALPYTSSSSMIAPEIPVPALAPDPLSPLLQNQQTLHHDSQDVAFETTHSLNILTSLFGGKDDMEWVGRESPGSDVDVDGLTRGQVAVMGEDNVDFEIVPMDTGGGDVWLQDVHEVQEGIEESIHDMQVEEDTRRPPTQKQQQAMKLKDLFAPREEGAGFSLLGHLDLDLELDGDTSFSTSALTQVAHALEAPCTPTFASLPSNSPPPGAVFRLNPRLPLFFPLPRSSGVNNKARPKDVFDVAKDNWWNWRDPDVGFYRTGTEDDIRARWDTEKGELTREWKRRWREAGKVSRRRGDTGDRDGGIGNEFGG